MGYVTTDDGIRIYVETAGAGKPILFIHEFAGDHRSWRPQVEHFATRYRCVTYAARGYPPSDVPEDLSAYSQLRAVADAIAVLDDAGIDKANVVGLSMGGFCALHMGLRHPERVSSLVVAGCGYGAPNEVEKGFRAECEAIAVAFLTKGADIVAETYALGPARVQFQRKNPSGWAEFAAALAEHSSLGSALTMRGVQKARPSLYRLTDELAAMEIPTLIISGDEDEGCLEPDLMLKRTIPASGLMILPKSGHTLNLEEPAEFNRAVAGFLRLVERGEWGPRDPRARIGSITGIGPHKDVVVQTL